MSWAREIIGVTRSAVNEEVRSTARSAVNYATNQALTRLESNGLVPGARMLGLIAQPETNVQFSGSEGKGTDWRIKISCPAMGFGGVMAPLGNVGGVIFPHTPTVNVTYQANYAAQRFTHSNYPHYTYENSEVQAIQINGEFSAQNKSEAEYVLGCIYFFRAVTKMYFANSANVGNPPPLVFLDGYGSYYFPHVPCLVTQFTHVMPPDVDYIESGNGTRIPALSQISIQLQPTYSKRVIANSFDLDGFASGNLVDKGFI
jgi:hypothetical protein